MLHAQQASVKMQAHQRIVSEQNEYSVTEYKQVVNIIVNTNEDYIINLNKLTKLAQCVEKSIKQLSNQVFTLTVETRGQPLCYG